MTIAGHLVDCIACLAQSNQRALKQFTSPVIKRLVVELNYNLTLSFKTSIREVTSCSFPILRKLIDVPQKWLEAKGINGSSLGEKEVESHVKSMRDQKPISWVSGRDSQIIKWEVPAFHWLTLIKIFEWYNNLSGSTIYLQVISCCDILGSASYLWISKCSTGFGLYFWPCTS